ncbi:MAG: hypothetical protein AAF235_03600 [Planctomycetota bacterium]
MGRAEHGDDGQKEHPLEVPEPDVSEGADCAVERSREDDPVSGVLDNDPRAGIESHRQNGVS